MAGEVRWMALYGLFITDREKSSCFLPLGAYWRVGNRLPVRVLIMILGTVFLKDGLSDRFWPGHEVWRFR